MQKKELAKLCMRLEGQVRNELNLKESMTDDEIASLADQIIIQESKVTNLSLSEKLYIKEHVFHALRGYDCLEDIMRDDGIT
ncbi:MAG: hypothetical protein IJ079_04035, partial [Lachnospiraceae bacterium]|nr:hypothetical protein [Lachnospiraceae bacterium]